MIIPDSIDLATATREELVAAFEADGLTHDEAEAHADALLDDNPVV